MLVDGLHFSTATLQPPRPAYKDPEALVASTRKANSDTVQTWSVTEVDQKGKKKKGTLGVGNGAVFFASESDKVHYNPHERPDKMLMQNKTDPSSAVENCRPQLS
jgi:hypothetical protein